MSFIAFTPSNAAFDSRDIGRVYAVLGRQFSVALNGSFNSGNLLIGKLSIPMLDPKRESIFLCGILKVNLIRSLKKMRGIEALRVIALVANKNILGQLSAMSKNIHKAMNTPRNAFVHDKAVAFRFMRSPPLPAPVGCDFTTFQKPFHNRLKTGFMAFLNALSPIRHVMVSAHAATYNRRLSANLARIHATSLYDIGVSSISMCHTQGR
jgi:hypothetical protein